MFAPAGRLFVRFAVDHQRRRASVERSGVGTDRVVALFGRFFQRCHAAPQPYLFKPRAATEGTGGYPLEWHLQCRRERRAPGEGVGFDGGDALREDHILQRDAVLKGGGRHGCFTLRQIKFGQGNTSRKGIAGGFAGAVKRRAVSEFHRRELRTALGLAAVIAEGKHGNAQQRRHVGSGNPESASFHSDLHHIISRLRIGVLKTSRCGAGKWRDFRTVAPVDFTAAGINEGKLLFQRGGQREVYFRGRDLHDLLPDRHAVQFYF